MDKFIRKIILDRSIWAAFQRGKVYKKNIADRERYDLRQDIKDELKRIGKEYKKQVSESDHINNIKQLSGTVSKKHAKILRKGKLRIGTSQKLLNVYIKFLWCLDEAAEPPHCPIDRTVLNESGVEQKWTDIETISEYKEVISKIRKHIRGESLANWEWRLWNKEG